MRPLVATLASSERTKSDGLHLCLWLDSDSLLQPEDGEMSSQNVDFMPELGVEGRGMRGGGDRDGKGPRPYRGGGRWGSDKVNTAYWQFTWFSPFSLILENVHDIMLGRPQALPIASHNCRANASALSLW